MYLSLKTFISPLFLGDKKRDIELEIIPTIREKTGLAMSSRNARLNETEKENATAIFKAMVHIKNYLNEKNFDELEKEANELLQKNGFEKIDYKIRFILHL